MPRIILRKVTDRLVTRHKNALQSGLSPGYVIVNARQRGAEYQGKQGHEKRSRGKPDHHSRLQRFQCPHGVELCKN